MLTLRLPPDVRVGEPQVVSEEAPPLKRPDWFPQGELLERFTELSKDPRKNGAALQELLGGQTRVGSDSGY